MADTYVPLSFVADELLTSTKMNQLAANQDNFHNGTALGDGIIVTRHIANRIRRAPMFIQGDGVTATNTHTEGAPEVSFSGTNSDYARGCGTIPQDYVTGTAGNIVLHFRSTDAQSKTPQYYIGCHGPSSSWSSWNVISSANQPNFAFTTDMKEMVLSTTIGASFMAAGGTVVFALGAMGAITGAIILVAAELEYTADS